MKKSCYGNIAHKIKNCPHCGSDDILEFSVKDTSIKDTRFICEEETIKRKIFVMCKKCARICDLETWNLDKPE